MRVRNPVKDLRRNNYFLKKIDRLILKKIMMKIIFSTIFSVL